MVGERLREARTAQHLSLAQVAEKAGISAATLSRIETNKQNVDLGLFLVIARVLHVAPHEMLGDESPGTESDPLARRIAGLGAPQRARLWRDLATARRSDRSARHSVMRPLGQQVEELVAQIDFLREEVDALRARVKRRK